MIQALFLQQSMHVLSFFCFCSHIVIVLMETFFNSEDQKSLKDLF